MDEGSDPATAAGDSDGAGNGDPGADADAPTDVETLRRRVEEKYDFEHFTPADMVEMTVDEWEAAFDADAWITGPALLDRVEAELRSRVARRNLFAVVERTTVDGQERVLAYDDVGYAMVGRDGTVEGEGPMVEDVEPVVALCSMEDFDVAEPPADAGLPDPDDVEPESGGLGDTLLLAVAVVQVVAGLGLLLAPLFVDLNPDGPERGAALLTTVAGLGFLAIGIVIGLLVANARLSGRFRAAEYRERLLAAGVGGGERPSFLPDADAERPGVEGAGDPPERNPD